MPSFWRPRTPPRFQHPDWLGVLPAPRSGAWRRAAHRRPVTPASPRLLAVCPCTSPAAVGRLCVPRCHRRSPPGHPPRQRWTARARRPARRNCGRHGARRRMRDLAVHQEHVADWRMLLGVGQGNFVHGAHSFPRRHLQPRRPRTLQRAPRGAIWRAGKPSRPLELEIALGDAIARLSSSRRRRFRCGRLKRPASARPWPEFYIRVATEGDLSGLSRTRSVARGPHRGDAFRPDRRSVISATSSSPATTARWPWDYSPGSADLRPGILQNWADASGEAFDFCIGDERPTAQSSAAPTPMFAFAIIVSDRAWISSVRLPLRFASV